MLGPLEVELDGTVLDVPPSRRGRALLAYLATHPGRHTRSRLAAEFWPDVPDSSARTSLRGALAELRRSLGPAASVLVATREWVELVPDGAEVDLLTFADHVREGRWEEALELDRGRLLVDVDDGWTDQLREDHAAGLMTALARGAAERESQGRLDEAVRLVRRRLRLDPLSEPVGRELVRLLLAAGDRAAALEAGRELTERLRSELGVSPDAETQAVLAALRSASPRVPSAAFAPPPLVSRTDNDLVGRAEALHEVRATLEARDRRVLLVSGEAGIGKTALALTAARALAESGATVLFGRCDDESIVPYEPWVEALGHLLDQLDETQARQVATDGGAELARLFPRLPGATAIASPDAEAEPDTRRWRLFEVVAELVSGLAASRPVLLVLDDVQWADRSSLLLLRHVLRSRPHADVTVLMTAREAEVDPDAPLHQALAALRREETVTRLHLAGLDEREVAELVRRRRGVAQPPDLVRALHEETEGNPFFVEEILRNIPRAHRQDGMTRAFHVPDGVHDLVRRRLSRLDDTAQTVLTLAAVVGRDFTLHVVEGALDLDGEVVLDALDSAVRATLVQEVAVGHYSFAHALVRAALYESLSRTRRARLHIRVAETLRRSADEPGRRPGEIAHHYLEGGDPAHVGPAVGYLREAHQEAMDQFAYEEAALNAERALAALDRTAHADRSSVASLLIDLGEARSRAGDADAARRAFAQVAGAARSAQDGELLGQAALGFAGPSWRSFGVVDEEGVRLLEEALAAVPPGRSELRARLQARLAIALYFTRQPERVRELTEAAVRTARELGDTTVLAAALEARLWATWRPSADEERLATAEELLDLATAVGASETATTARRWRVVALLEAGRIEEVWAEAARHAEAARRLRLPYELMYVAVFDAMRAFLEGRVEDAAAASAQVAAFGELRGGADALQFGGVHALTFAHLGGDLSGVVGGIEQFARGYPALPAWRGALAYGLVAVGRPEEASAEVESLWPPERTLPFDAVWLPGMAFLSLAVARLGDAARAGHLIELLSEHAHRPVVLGAGGAVWGTVADYLVELAAVTGDARQLERRRIEAAEGRRTLQGSVLSTT